MNDRELLGLAAKAAGIEIIRWGKTDGAFVGLGAAWSPLTDDGDAFRLAFALEMSVDMYGCIIGHSEDSQYEFENTTGDIAHVRRAIVEVAAYLGKDGAN